MYEKIKDQTVEEQRERRAILVSVHYNSKDKELCEDHLNELELLCDTYGLQTLKKIPYQVREFNASTYITTGKVEMLQKEIEELKPDLIVFDDEISPAQQRNLEEIFKIPVIDRTEVILGVFEQRAHSKEAHLQVELARTEYLAPRLKRMWTHLSRQAATAGGGAYLKGKGEKQIEVDRRALKDRISLLHKEIDEVRAHRGIQRGLREKSEIPTFAIIGYTNAGKSTLLNALTDAGVFTEDKLFATLDTTTRKFTLSNNQDILLIDTVGFIRKLPHLLVAAFRSTLEEATQADILLHIIDASHPMALEQAEATFDVLKELEAKKKPIVTILNKVDRPESRAMLTRLRLKYPKTVQISAVDRTGFDQLLEAMQEELSKQRQRVSLRIPQKDYRVVSELMKVANILEQSYDENDVLIKAELPIKTAGRLKDYIENDPEKTS